MPSKVRNHFDADRVIRLQLLHSPAARMSFCRERGRKWHFHTELYTPWNLCVCQILHPSGKICVGPISSIWCWPDKQSGPAHLYRPNMSCQHSPNTRPIHANAHPTPIKTLFYILLFNSSIVYLCAHRVSMLGRVVTPHLLNPQCVYTFDFIKWTQVRYSRNCFKMWHIHIYAVLKKLRRNWLIMIGKQKEIMLFCRLYVSWQPWGGNIC